MQDRKSTDKTISKKKGEAPQSNFKSNNKPSKISETHRKFSCSRCGKGYTTKAGLKSHIAFIHDRISFPCNICNAEFGRKLSLKNHLEGHHKSALCPICSIVIKLGHQYEKHVKVCKSNQINEACVDALALRVVTVRKGCRKTVMAMGTCGEVEGFCDRV